jgi:hypothetical protein
MDLAMEAEEQPLLTSFIKQRPVMTVTDWEDLVCHVVKCSNELYKCAINLVMNSTPIYSHALIHMTILYMLFFWNAVTFSSANFLWRTGTLESLIWETTSVRENVTQRGVLLEVAVQESDVMNTCKVNEC